MLIGYRHSTGRLYLPLEDRPLDTIAEYDSAEGLTFQVVAALDIWGVPHLVNASFPLPDWLHLPDPEPANAPASVCVCDRTSRELCPLHRRTR